MEENLIVARSIEYDEIIYGIDYIEIDEYRAYLVKKDLNLEIVWKNSLYFFPKIESNKGLSRTLKY